MEEGEAPPLPRLERRKLRPLRPADLWTSLCRNRGRYFTACSRRGAHALGAAAVSPFSLSPKARLPVGCRPCSPRCATLPSVLYGLIRSLVALAVRLFYRVEATGPAEEAEGPAIFVGNHPNGLIDPTLIFVATQRRVTFMAKAPLFKMPVVGMLLRGLGALPVYRRQDDPGQTSRNEGTFEAAGRALSEGGAIMLFPEGISHSAPGLAELKTGAARIALRVLKQGTPLKIVPVGLTYSEKHRFRSAVLVERGTPMTLADPSALGADESEQVRALTERMAAALRGVTLNLEAWEDLPLAQTAEQLYAMQAGEGTSQERLRRWARGVSLLRREEPARFEALRSALMSFRQRLVLVRSDPTDLALVYRAGPVSRFIGKNLLSLVLGFPFFAVGLVLFVVPYHLPRLAVRAAKQDLDVVATVKFLTLLLVAPLWWALLTVLGWHAWGWEGGLAAWLVTPALALFTRYFLERWQAVLRDVSTFFVLGSRAELKRRLLLEGESLTRTLEPLVAQYGERADAAVGVSHHR